MSGGRAGWRILHGALCGVGAMLPLAVLEVAQLMSGAEPSLMARIHAARTAFVLLVGAGWFLGLAAASVLEPPPLQDRLGGPRAFAPRLLLVALGTGGLAAAARASILWPQLLAWPLAWLGLRGAGRVASKLRGAGLLLAAASSLIFVLAGLLGRHTSRAVFWRHAQASRPWAEAALAMSDWDRDGFGALLHGGDCLPLDAAVHPLAADPPGDGRDSNCDGIDGPPPGSELPKQPFGSDSARAATLRALCRGRSPVLFLAPRLPAGEPRPPALEVPGAGLTVLDHALAPGLDPLETLADLRARARAQGLPEILYTLGSTRGAAPTGAPTLPPDLGPLLDALQAPTPSKVIFLVLVEGGSPELDAALRTFSRAVRTRRLAPRLLVAAAGLTAAPRRPGAPLDGLALRTEVRIALPGHRPARLPTVVGVGALIPTILDALGEASSEPARSLLPLLASPREAPSGAPAPVFARDGARSAVVFRAQALELQLPGMGVTLFPLQSFFAGTRANYADADAPSVAALTELLALHTSKQGVAAHGRHR